MLFDATFNVSQNSEAPKKFILSAKKKYEIGLHVGPFDKNYSKTLNQAFDEADCNNCHLTQKKLTNSPIEFVFDTIKYGDVFIVTKFKKQFKVELYQKK